MTYKPVIYISITAAVSPYHRTYTHDIVSYAMAAIVADRHFACHHRNSCDEGVGFNVNTSGILEKHYDDWMHQMCLKIWTNDNLVDSINMTIIFTSSQTAHRFIVISFKSLLQTYHLVTGSWHYAKANILVCHGNYSIRGTVIELNQKNIGDANS